MSRVKWTDIPGKRDPETTVEPSQTLDLHQLYGRAKRADVLSVRRDLCAGLDDFGRNADEACHLRRRRGQSGGETQGEEGETYEFTAG